jgi:hypothetical protein
MKTLHTPGPWMVNSSAVKAKWPFEPILICEVNLISFVAGGEKKAPHKEQLANLNLIAAAPELLEALKVVCSYLGDCEDPHDPSGQQLQRIIDKGIAAIKKATE